MFTVTRAVKGPSFALPAKRRVNLSVSSPRQKTGDSQVRDEGQCATRQTAAGGPAFSCCLPEPRGNSWVPDPEGQAVSAPGGAGVVLCRSSSPRSGNLTFPYTRLPFVPQGGLVFLVWSSQHARCGVQRGAPFLSSTRPRTEGLRQRPVGFSLLVPAEPPETLENRLPKDHRVNYLVKVFLPELTLAPALPVTGCSLTNNPRGPVGSPGGVAAWLSLQGARGVQSAHSLGRQRSGGRRVLLGPEAAAGDDGAAGLAFVPDMRSSVRLSLWGASCGLVRGLSQTPCSLGLPRPVSLSPHLTA